MIRRKTIQLSAPLTTRWAAWAAQMVARHTRWADVQRLRLPLYARLCQTPLRLYQHRVSFHTQLNPQLKLSIAARGVWNIESTHTYAPQMVFLQSFAGLIEKSLRLEIERKGQRSKIRPPQPEFRLAAPAPLNRDGVQKVAMTLAIARTRTEQLASTFHRLFSIRQESEFTDVSRHLTRRMQRVDEVLASRPQMALRKEAPAVVTPAHAPSAAMQEQSSFERRGGPQTAQAIAAPALNVEHLADQVLKQIDRRVIARRERMGQV